MAISEQLKNNQITLVIIDKLNYIAKSLDVLISINQLDIKNCYIALNKPYGSIMANMQKNDIDTSKYLFIDVLTSTVQEPPAVANCLFVESPNAITDLSVSFSKAMFEYGCELALFDAISNLLIYQDQATVIKLSQNLMTKIRVGGKKAVFIVLKEDSEELVKDLAMFVDEMIEI